MFRLVRFSNAVLAAAFLMFTLVAPASAQEPLPIGQVVEQRGPVTAMRAGDPRSLAKGAPVYQGDWIATGADSRVQIELSDGSRISLGADSRVEIDALVYGSDGQGLRGVFKLVLGILRASLAGPLWPDGFSVETRAAIASVRSTDFVTEAVAGKTSVFVVEGRVEVAPGEARALVLDAGQGVDVPQGAAAVQAVKWARVRVEDVLARTRVP